MKVVAQSPSSPILVRNNRSYISALTLPTCLGCKEYQDGSTASLSDESSTLFTGLKTTRTTTANNVVGPAMLLSPAAAAPCCGSNTADVAPTIDDEEMMDTRSTFPYHRRNNNERKQTNKLSSCTVEDMCERFVAFCDPLLTVCVPCASASGSSSSSSSKTISKQNKTRNRVAIGNTKRRSNKTQHDNKSTTAMYNEEEHD